MKTRVEVQIPLDKIDELSKKKIQSLERENTKLKNKVQQMQSLLDNQKFTIEKAHKIIEAVREAGEFCHDGCYGDHC